MDKHTTKLSELLESTKAFIQSITGPLTETELAEVIQAAADDIKFNLISFGKMPNQETVTTIAVRCHITLTRCRGGGEVTNGSYSYKECS